MVGIVVVIGAAAAMLALVGMSHLRSTPPHEAAHDERLAAEHSRPLANVTVIHGNAPLPTSGDNNSAT